MNTSEYTVTGMTCGHCESAVREEVSQLVGVTNVQVAAATGRLLITSESPLDDADVAHAVDEAGYTLDPR